ncbi:MAG TPA: L-rhamnose isomerase [Candidatus Limiplasma sp.]|nr:L-rhamnose isomerase [Candidatus Limiplasma sp.]HRX07763.1 L-rhamnose isomerase [Candidatus Limiplasma sp.]
MSGMYELAREKYRDLGINTEAAIRTLQQTPISIHCWQGDDVGGFENTGETLSGGIQATGNYMGKARTPDELMADFEKAISLIGGMKRINLHACYAIFEAGDAADRDALLPRHFEKWVAFARKNHLGIDFNPTFFSHPMVKGGLTLSSPDEEVRGFWVRHGIACRKIAAYFAKELGTHCLCNIWIPDGFKDVPADRFSPRLTLQKSLDEIFSERLDGVIDCVESKVFGIGVEAYTVGSSEFYLGYAASRDNVYDLMDSGHYHPTEVISDKISAMLCYFDRIPLHVTRPVRWDSDHVVRLDDELKEIATELVRNNALDKAMIGLDFFDASINRVAAWIIGTRNMQKALLHALLMPHQALKALQDGEQFTELMARQEALKMMPISAVWDEFCRREAVPDDMTWFESVKQYENDVLSHRGNCGNA